MSSAASTVPSIPNNLPLQLTSFVGREREIAEVKRLLRVSRLLTLTGAGGSGKTRLALQIAADMLDELGAYKHGVHFVSLASIRDPGLLISAIAQTLDVRESPGQPLEASLKAYLHDKHLLLLLDNFEQIVAAAPQVVDLLKAAPDLKVLVTSRASLQVSGEQQYPVPPLTLPDLGKLPELEALSEVEAVKLFVQRATSVKPQFTLAKQNSQAIAEICHRLDGLPLAIELAAARMNVLTPQVMLEKLSSSLTLLTSGARDRPARHQTLRSAMEWSYSLLDTAEQKLFRRMAVFVGGCTLEAIEAVCTAKGNLAIDVLDGVASLVDKSLLRQEEGVRGEPGFWMLETIDEYAREKLQESGEAEALHKEHAFYFMRLAEAAEPHLPGKQQQAWLERLEVEHDNFRAALRWAVASGEAGSAKAGTAATSNEAQTAHAPTARERATTGNAAALTLEIGLRTAGALRQFWDVRGYYREGGEDLQRLLSAADRLGCSRAVRVKALNAAGVLTYRQGEYAAARSTLEQALAMGSELGDRQSMALSLHHLGNAAFGQGDYAAARSLYQESLALRKDLGDKWGIAICLTNLGSVAYLQGDDSAARSLYEESLALFREEGDKWGITVPLINLGNVAYLQGDYSAARSLCEEGLVTSKDIGSTYNIAISMAALGGIAAATGQPQRGARLLGAADALLQGIGSVLEAENRRPYQAGVASARAQLGEAEFEKAMQQGRSMLMEQAIAYALDPTLLPTEEPSAPAQAPAPAPAPGAGSGTRPSYPEGLTRREVEVLRVLAEGLSNAQIAQRLFLSPNTVNVHLYSIFSKLGVTTRTAAARFAVERKLV